MNKNFKSCRIDVGADIGHDQACEQIKTAACGVIPSDKLSDMIIF